MEPACEMGLHALSEVISYFDVIGRSDALDDGIAEFRCRHKGEDSSDEARMENDPNRYLQEFAVDDELQRRCKTYLVVNDESYRDGKLEILGYFTISMSVFDLSRFSESIKSMLLGDRPGRPSGEYAPAYLIAQLACSDKTTRSEFSGASLLDFAEDVVERATELAGGNIVYLQCCDELIGYYTNLGYAAMTSLSDEKAPNIMVKLITTDMIEDDLDATVPMAEA